VLRFNGSVICNPSHLLFRQIFSAESNFFAKDDRTSRLGRRDQRCDGGTPSLAVLLGCQQVIWHQMSLDHREVLATIQTDDAI
jgi:hypothetical protein